MKGPTVKGGIQKKTIFVGSRHPITKESKSKGIPPKNRKAMKIKVVVDSNGGVEEVNRKQVVEELVEEE